MNEYDRRCCGWKDERIADLERRLAERERSAYRAARECDAYITKVEGKLVDTLNQLSATRAELAEARAILADFVRETDAWNVSVAAILGRPPGYCWQTLERARAALAPVTESASEGGENG